MILSLQVGTTPATLAFTFSDNHPGSQSTPLSLDVLVHISYPIEMIAEEPRASFYQQRILEGEDSTTTFPADPQQVGILVCC